MKAIFQGRVIAESNETVVVEGNHYFPRSSVNEGAIKPNSMTSVCPWKGTASYFDVLADDGTVASGAAWVYPTPKPEAEQIKDHLAFWKGVEVVDS